jgi:hypothetical protein
MGGDGDDEDSKSNKIITKIAKEVVIYKSPWEREDIFYIVLI